ncbi:MAG TPA: peptide-methionine (S)-S-oxide reductase MsrA [Ktedonobacterales bacterium]
MSDEKRGESAKVTATADTTNTTEPQGAGRALQKATFGAGCFWGVEVAFRNTPGVVDAIVGYEGGTLANPTYQNVCSHTTGHAEVVEVTYDPAEVSYDTLLNVFWNEHDPTQLNRQGPDIGDQYRSVIFFHTPEQEAEARASKERLQASGKYRRPIVTAIEPAQTFYRAEEYHQRYLEKHGLATCRI